MAYRCSACRNWIPREGHAPTCSRMTGPRFPQIAQASPVALSTAERASHPSSTGKSQGCGSSDPQGDSLTVEYMDTHPEVVVRLEAADAWIKHAINGECSVEDAATAVVELVNAARGFTGDAA